ncbi:hypothetical protein Hdeb2414_s0001g00014281 [Helianthus debilis subsp. tardiflorus]
MVEPQDDLDGSAYPSLIPILCGIHIKSGNSTKESDPLYNFGSQLLLSVSLFPFSLKALLNECKF